MKAKLTLTLGSKKLELDGEGDTKSIIKAFAFWSNLPTTCGKCKSPEIALNYKSPQGNDYYGLKCTKCTAEINFGQNKNGGTLFLKKEEWEIWSGGNDLATKLAPPKQNYEEEAPF